MRRRVVITGMGVVTPLGHTVADLYTSQVEGRTAVGPLTRFDARTMPTTFASEVTGFELEKYLRDPRRYAHCGVNTQFAIGATKEALADAGLLDEGRGDRGRMGVYLGSGEGAEDFPALINSVAAATDDSGKADPTAFSAAILKVLHGEREAEMEMH
ncbi:beta-ketoacyl-[acyl-carrier-protein] synthase II, partial [bacterium]|nr:beta-ketoacyl-[acyl-carrier-protein] synthase II [bacterium]